MAKPSPPTDPSSHANPGAEHTTPPSTPSAPDLLAAGVELLVFAPLGFALKARTLVPELVKSGREEWQRRSTVARFVGKMVVDGSRRNLQQRRAAAATPPMPKAPPAEGREEVRAEATVAPPSAKGAAATPASTATVAQSKRRPRASTAVPTTTTLPISGYDTLATQSIIELLNGLDAPGLRGVERYEAAHRARRTILTRVAQLRAAT